MPHRAPLLGVGQAFCAERSRLVDGALVGPLARICAVAGMNNGAGGLVTVAIGHGILTHVLAEQQNQPLMQPRSQAMTSPLLPARGSTRAARSSGRCHRPLLRHLCHRLAGRRPCMLR